jgi:hypothetical protein
MSGSLSVEIAPPKDGGMTLALSSGEQRFSDNFTFAVFPFLTPLLGALRVLQEGGHVDEKIRLLLGAPELEIRIRAEVDELETSLCVDVWPDARRSKFVQPSRLFSFAAPRQEIVFAFVAALRKLSASADAESESGSWFPRAEYDRLMATVE